MPKKALLYQLLADNKVQCQLCCHYCTLTPGQEGLCGVRKNIDGVLYSLNYGKVCALEIDPIEKKSLFHFGL